MRKKLLIKPRLQLKYLAWTSGTIMVCVFAGYVLCESIIRHALPMGSVGQAERQVLIHMLQFGFLITTILCLLGIGLENYFFFHRIVGPLFALERGLKRFAEGDFKDVTQVRSSDELQDVISAFETMKKDLQLKIEAHQSASRVLTEELDDLLREPSLRNIESLRLKIQEIRAHAEKRKAA